MSEQQKSKTDLVRALLRENPSVDPKEAIEKVGCSDVLFYTIRATLFPEVKRKYKKRKKSKKTDSVINTLRAATQKVNAIVDMVNSPDHYTKGGIETYDFIKAKGLSYELGNVVKYVSRANHKGKRLEDLQKARWYLDAAIKQEEAR